MFHPHINGWAGMKHLVILSGRLISEKGCCISGSVQMGKHRQHTAGCTMSKMKSKRNVGRGFTLVELLVVIGIIALLISILMPALGKVKEQANTVACLANLRQIGQAAVMYANDNKGQTVPAGYRNLGAGPYPTGDEHFATILVFKKYLPLPTPAPADNQGPTATSSVFHCPSGRNEIVSSTLGGTSPFNKYDPAGQCPWRVESVIGGWNIDLS